MLLPSNTQHLLQVSMELMLPLDAPPDVAYRLLVRECAPPDAPEPSKLLVDLPLHAVTTLAAGAGGNPSRRRHAARMAMSFDRCPERRLKWHLQPLPSSTSASTSPSSPSSPSSPGAAYQVASTLESLWTYEGEVCFGGCCAVLVGIVSVLPLPA